MIDRSHVKRLGSSLALRQFSKFSVVGVLNVLISTVVFYLCYEEWHIGSGLFVLAGSAGEDLRAFLQGFGIGSLDGLVATIIGYVAGMANSFFLNRSWTFGTRGVDVIGQMRRFVILNLIGLSTSSAAMFIFVDLLRWPYMAVWTAVVALMLMLNFLGNKYWTFVVDGARADQISR